MRIADILSRLRYENGVYYQSGPNRFNDFEKDYLGVRQSEGRVYSDEQVKELPHLTASPLSKEWKMRETSAWRLVAYAIKKKPKLILEIGCGNGWLSNLLAKEGAEVVALDVNETELLQGARVFRERDNLHFVCGDVFSDLFDDQLTFDMVLLSSSIQYFDDLEVLLWRLKGLLSGEGEIHIIDSPIYDSRSVVVAATKSKTYFMQLEVTGEQFYFHHTWRELDDFNYTVLYNPNSLMRRIRRAIMPDSPFYWIKIIR